MDVQLFSYIWIPVLDFFLRLLKSTYLMKRQVTQYSIIHGIWMSEICKNRQSELIWSIWWPQLREQLDRFHKRSLTVGVVRGPNDPINAWRKIIFVWLSKVSITTPSVHDICPEEQDGRCRGIHRNHSMLHINRDSVWGMISLTTEFIRRSCYKRWVTCRKYFSMKLRYTYQLVWELYVSSLLRVLEQRPLQEPCSAVVQRNNSTGGLRIINHLGTSRDHLKIRLTFRKNRHINDLRSWTETANRSNFTR